MAADQLLTAVKAQPKALDALQKRVAVRARALDKLNESVALVHAQVGTEVEAAQLLAAQMSKYQVAMEDFKLFMVMPPSSPFFVFCSRRGCLRALFHCRDGSSLSAL
jgi:hypothetical protein